LLVQGYIQVQQAATSDQAGWHGCSSVSYVIELPCYLLNIWHRPTLNCL